jgi:hypothetical protein
METSERTLARRSIAAVIAAAGGVRAVTQLLGVQAQTVSRWKARGKIPTIYVKQLCAASGLMTAEQLLRVMVNAKIAEELKR